MSFRRAIPPCTPGEQRRQDLARALGCIACRIERERYGRSLTHDCGPTEIEHQTISGRQISQLATIALGSFHHRAICIDGLTTSEMTELFGPSQAKGSKPFHARYGDNQILLELQDRLIRENER
jgi:hypothetical protein